MQRLWQLGFCFVTLLIVQNVLSQNSPLPTGRSSSKSSSTTTNEDEISKFLESELSLATDVPPVIIPKGSSGTTPPNIEYLDKLPHATEQSDSAIPVSTTVSPLPEDTLVIAVVNSNNTSDDVDTFVVNSDDVNGTNVKPIDADVLRELFKELNSMNANATTVPESFPDPPPLILSTDDSDTFDYDAPASNITTTTEGSLAGVILSLPDVISQLNSTQPVAANSPAQFEGERPSGQFFCLAQCMASCFNTESVDPTQCKDICLHYETSTNLCQANDAECWKNCNKDMSAPAFAPKTTPKISGFNYIDNSDFTSQLIRIFWDPVPNATLYVIEIIPNPTSMMNGAEMVRDMSLKPFYQFEKPNLCYEYYARISAVNMYGVGQFGPSQFVQNTPSQLPLSFNLIDSFVQTSSLDIGSSGMTSHNTLQVVARLSYEDDSTTFNLANFDITYYLLASQCRQPVTSIFEETTQSTLPGKVYKVNAVSYVYDPFSVTLYLPTSILSSDCQYTFRVASIVNTCGKSVFFATAGYNSEVGTNFRLNCETVRDSMCSMYDIQIQQPPAAFGTNVERTPIVVPNLPVSIYCQMTGFTVDVGGGKKNDKLNVTIRWDAIIDDFSKVYFVRHGSAVRSLVISALDDILFDYDYPVPVVDDINNPFTKSMNLPSMDKNLLHSFQICVAYGGPGMDDFPWDTAETHVVDLAAYDDPNFQSSAEDPAVVAVVDDGCNVNKPSASWIVVVCSLFVAILCFAMMFLLVVYTLCCARRRRTIRKIFVKNISTIEPQQQQQQQQIEKPAPIIAA